ncbi:MAG: hypothetical protein Q7J69_05940 [Candidatus Omnitrophota bacterium]|nr:hypothetical protein [Candidatus Omnitrophota bacterium]
MVTSAVGYWTLTAAGKEKGRVKTLGQYLGFLIIVLSLAGAALKVACSVQACKAGGGMYSKNCPFTGKPMGGMAACPAGHPGCTMNCPPAEKSAK